MHLEPVSSSRECSLPSIDPSPIFMMSAKRIFACRSIYQVSASTTRPAQRSTTCVTLVSCATICWVAGDSGRLFRRHANPHPFDSYGAIGCRRSTPAGLNGRATSVIRLWAVRERPPFGCEAICTKLVESAIVSLIHFAQIDGRRDTSRSSFKESMCALKKNESRGATASTDSPA